MEFTEYMLWKLAVLSVIAFLLGLFNLLPKEEPNEQLQDEDS